MNGNKIAHDPQPNSYIPHVILHFIDFMANNIILPLGSLPFNKLQIKMHLQSIYIHDGHLQLKPFQPTK